MKICIIADMSPEKVLNFARGNADAAEFSAYHTIKEFYETIAIKNESFDRILVLANKEIAASELRLLDTYLADAQRENVVQQIDVICFAQNEQVALGFVRGITYPLACALESTALSGPQFFKDAGSLSFVEFQDAHKTYSNELPTITSQAPEETRQYAAPTMVAEQDFASMGVAHSDTMYFDSEDEDSAELSEYPQLKLNDFPALSEAFPTYVEAQGGAFPVLNTGARVNIVIGSTPNRLFTYARTLADYCSQRGYSTLIASTVNNEPFLSHVTSNPDFYTEFHRSLPISTPYQQTQTLYVTSPNAGETLTPGGLDEVTGLIPRFDYTIIPVFLSGDNDYAAQIKAISSAFPASIHWVSGTAFLDASPRVKAIATMLNNFVSRERFDDDLQEIVASNGWLYAGEPSEELAMNATRLGQKFVWNRDPMFRQLRFLAQPTGVSA